MDSSYFGPDLSAGSYSSQGYVYQDICALYYFFHYINRGKPVISLGLEMVNDFTIHQSESTITAQVKMRSLSLNEIIKISESTPHTSADTLLIICTSFKEKSKQIISKLNQYKNAMQSNLNEDWKISITEDLYKELQKRGINHRNCNLLNSEFADLPQNMTNVVLFFEISRWLDKRKLAVNLPTFIDRLLLLVSSLRSERSFMSIDKLEELVKEHSTESIATEIIKQAYQTHFIQPNQALTLLGETQKEILNGLEEQLLLADKYIQSEKYREALDIYLTLNKIYSKQNIKLHCASLFLSLNEYDNALKFSSEILESNPDHYQANAIKGIGLCLSNQYIEAIEQLKITLLIVEKVSYLTYYYLGFSYWASEQDNLIYEAINCFKSCIELNENFIDVHFNLSQIYLQRSLYMDSLMHINKVIELNPDLDQAYSHKGELYRYFGLYDNAIESFKECLSRNPKDRQSLYGISLSLVEQGYIAESAIYFNNLFKYHINDFFNPSHVKESERKSLFTDIGWKRTLIGTMEVKNNILEIDVYGKHFQIPLKTTTDYIFIGALPIHDDTGSLIHPIVGKVIEKTATFDNIKQRIEQAVKLNQLFTKNLYIDFNDKIEIAIKERETYILIEMIFNKKYKIIGVTDQKGNGWIKFKDSFEKYGECRIHFECVENSQSFDIAAIENVNIEYLNV